MDSTLEVQRGLMGGWGFIVFSFLGHSQWKWIFSKGEALSKRPPLSVRSLQSGWFPGHPGSHWLGSEAQFENIGQEFGKLDVRREK